VLRLHLLGGLALEVDGRRVDLPAGRRARSLLAWLALNRGAHSRAEVAGRFWPEVPETSARGSLRLALWAIRRALGAAADECLVATRDEVGLAANGSVWVDLAEFRRLLAERRYEEAVLLCRGEPLVELDDDWAYGVREEHREQLVDALGRLAGEADARGDVRQAVAWTRRQVAIDPLGEESCRELMRRLAAAGDRASALGAYERLRERLERELGIAPSPSTRKLAYALARGGEMGVAAPEQTTPSQSRATGGGEPGAAESPPPVPAPLARSDRSAFVGRRDELEWLRGQWRRARAGEIRTVLVGGEAGIGKSRLAAEFAAAAAVEGAAVLFGHTDEDPIVPFQPFVEALRRHVADTPLDELNAVLGPATSDLARLLPELQRRLRAIEPLGGRPEAERYLMFEAVASLLAQLSRSAPVVLVLEDLHWADRPTLLLLRHLARAPQRAALLILGTFREAEPGAGNDIAEVLADLRRDAVVTRLSLVGLGQADVGDLVASWSRVEPPQSLIHALHENTGGNPFFVEETVRHLEGAGVLRGDEWRWSARDSLEQAGVSAGVKEIVARRVATLGDTCRRLLDVGAVIGRTFELELLERVTGTPAGRIADVLEEAVGARVLTEETMGADGLYAFSHALVRETLYERLTRARRVRLHRAIVDAMEDLYAEDPGSRLGELAYHALQSARPQDAERASGYAAGAGEQAMERLAYEEAAAQFDRALVALDLGPEHDPLRRHELLVALGEALAKAGEPAGAADAFDAAAAAARELGRADLLGRAALGFAGSWALTRVAVESRAVDLLEEALAALDPAEQVLRTRLLTRLSEELYYTDERERRAELSGEALRLARGAGDTAALAAALGARHTAVWGQRRPEERLDVAKEMEDLGAQAGNAEIAFQGAAWSFADLLELGRVQEAESELARVLALAEELRQPAYRWWAEMLGATRASIDGEFHAVEARIREAAVWGRRAQIPTAEMYEEGQLHYLRVDHGRAGDAVEGTRRLASEYPAVPSTRCMLAEACAAAGLEEEARRELYAVAADEATQLMMNASWSVGMHSLAMACARVGDADLAAKLYGALLSAEPYCHVAFRGASFRGSVARTLGVLAATAEDAENADRHFRRAIEHNERIGALCQLLHARRDYGSFLQRQGDEDSAAELLTSARELGMRLGMSDAVPAVTS
jgi:DNA-binding SARP family transcriptional activator